MAIAVAFLAGTMFAIDSSVYFALDSYVSRHDRDFSVFAETAEGDRLADQVSAVPGIIHVAPYRRIGSGSEIRVGPPPGQFASIFAVEADRLPRFLESWHLSGTMSLSRGSTVVSDDVAAILGLQIPAIVEVRGSTYNWTSRSTETRFMNLTVEGVLTAPPDQVSPVHGFPFYSFLFIGWDDADWLESGLTGGVTPRVTVDAVIDRDSFLNPYDIEGTRRSLLRLQRQLEAIAAQYNGSVADQLSPILGYVEGFVAVARRLFLGLSAPIIVLGRYVGAIGVDLAHSERRRHLAILKTRGASPGQVFGLLILESLMIGSLAAGLGLLVGIGIGRVLVGSMSGFFYAAPGPTQIAVTLDTVILTAVFGALFTLFISYRSARRTATVPPVETLKYYRPGEAKIPYRPHLDLAFLAVGIGSFVLFLGQRAGVDALDFFAGPIGLALLPIAPFLIAVGLIRFVTRVSPRAYEWVSKGTAPLTRHLHQVVARNLERNPRRASDLAVILALGLAFGIMSLSIHHGAVAWEDGKVRADIGADLSVVPPSGNASFKGDIASIPGVVGVAAVQRIAVEPGSCGDIPRFPPCWEAFALDSDYFLVTRPEPWYYVDGTGERAREAFATVGSVLATEYYLRDTGYDIGDTLAFPYSAFNQSTQMEEARTLAVKIGGVVRGLPGVTSRDRIPWVQWWQIYGTEETFRPLLESASTGSAERIRLLVDLADDADWQAVKRAVLERGAAQVRAFEEERQGANTALVGRSFLGFLRLQAYFMMAVLIVGLVLVTVAASLEREVEFAAIAARGASGWQTATILIGEAVSVMLIGLSVGAAAGFLVAYVASTITSAGAAQGSVPLVPFPFIIPLETIAFAGGTVASLLVATLAIAWRVARLNLGRVLKLRAGCIGPTAPFGDLVRGFNLTRPHGAVVWRLPPLPRGASCSMSTWTPSTPPSKFARTQPSRGSPSWSGRTRGSIPGASS